VHRSTGPTGWGFGRAVSGQVIIAATARRARGHISKLLLPKIANVRPVRRDLASCAKKLYYSRHLYIGTKVIVERFRAITNFIKNQTPIRTDGGVKGIPDLQSKYAPTALYNVVLLVTTAD
jgi:hypothetical protein